MQASKSVEADPSLSRVPEPCNPAPYGQACAGCSSCQMQMFLSSRGVWVREFYLYSTELVIREYFVKKPRGVDQTGFSRIQRLQDLDLILTGIERWLGFMYELPLADWLTTLRRSEEPGWEPGGAVRQRADVLAILDRACDTIDRVPVALGMIDAKGPRRGLFFKMSYLLRAIHAMFLSEMISKREPSWPVQSASHGGGAGGSYEHGNASVAQQSGLEEFPEDFI
ncbi:hypothetical protein B0T17DRAFT_602074 [Bombardia bombarda]|uniref:Uncharacterized protein n=1 Tax=Bombardia bombarda TaxID=252184 RepID=A0AA39WGH6_9PEZI|nr:hypothetical protein B0T17DRAFT_602074 [Bombardia bombarda]